jgi:hypothetical protein
MINTIAVAAAALYAAVNVFCRGEAKDGPITTKIVKLRG